MMPRALRARASAQDLHFRHTGKAGIALNLRPMRQFFSAPVWCSNLTSCSRHVIIHRFNHTLTLAGAAIVKLLLSAFAIRGSRCAKTATIENG